MSFSAALLMPLMLLFPAAGAVGPEQDRPAECRLFEPATADRHVWSISAASPLGTLQHGAHGWTEPEFRPQPAHQVRIEQRMTIRISPRGPMPHRGVVGLPQHEIGPRFVERKIGKCLPISGISGVQTQDDNRIILFMRDRRIISAELERTCRARQFYSGFYLSRSRDGQLCVDRDVLQSRSGADCKLTRIRQLVEAGH